MTIANAQSNYSAYIAGIRAARDEAAKAEADIKANYKGAMLAEKLGELQTATQQILADLREQHEPIIRQAFEQVRADVRAIAARPIPEAMAAQLANLEGVTLSSVEMSAILDGIGTNYLARRKACSIFDVSGLDFTDGPMLLDELTKEIVSLEFEVMDSLGKVASNPGNVDGYQANNLDSGEWFTRVAEAVDAFTAAFPE